MKTIFTFLLLTAAVATAAPAANDLMLRQRNAANTAFVERQIADPAADSFLRFNNTSNLPDFRTAAQVLSDIGAQTLDSDLSLWAAVTPGTGIGAALALNVGSAGAPVVFNGALGTPSSGTVTNLTGTASININGTVGATTPASGAFTTIAASGAITQAADTNVSNIFGRIRLDSRVSDYAYFSHYDQTASGSYALRHGASGETALNAATGQAVSLCINSNISWSVNSSGHFAATGAKDVITTGNLYGAAGTFSGKLASTATAVTLGTAATTLAITSNAVKVTGDVGTNTLATITGGVSGQRLTLIFVGANIVTITDDATATANTVNLSAAFASTANDTITLVFDGTSWFEGARSVN